MKKLLALLLALVVSSVSADQTANLITNTWSGAVNYTGTGGGYSGGSTPGYNASTNTVYFGYNQGTVAQTIAINNALQGSGVQVGGVNYGMTYLNGGDAYGTLSMAVKVTSNTGSTLQNYTHSFNTINPAWQQFSQTQTFTNPYDLANLGNVSMSITGKDSRWWAGYYGPQVKNAYMNLTYTVDPCVANPAYSPSCPNYNTVNVSNNLVPNPGGYAVSGGTIDQSYAINQALALSGAGVMIHGFQWGYQANANSPYCAFWLLGCWDQRTPSVTTDVSITNSTGNTLYSVSRTYQNSYNTTSYSYLFPSSKNLLSLGRFNFSATTNDQAYIGDMWSRALYTPDPCTVNPLSSTSCPLYQQAFLEQQCASNPLYSTQCSGYAVAYFNQQCSANALYNPSCPGYASAYLNYQCSINPLYATTCAGYETAYFNQQCSQNALYNSRCPGYEQAYTTQQCSLNPLYSTTCTGYADAYFVQQCRLNPLYDVGCTGYAAAYKSQQCSLNALYATDCPGYASAYLSQQCSINSLYSTSCPNYATAYKAQQCSLNALYATDCPGYAQAYFTQQCNLNGLYDRTCPNYSEAYAKKMVLEQQGIASTVATAGVVASTAPTSTSTVSSEGTVSTTPSTTGSAIVDKALPPPATSANSAAAPAAPVQLVQAPPPPNAPTGPQQTKNEGGEKKPEGGPEKQSGPQPQMAQGGPQGGDKPQPTNRQALAERRLEAARKEAVEKGKNLANDMGKVADMESQKMMQNVVIQAMGFTPGFDAYGKVLVPDAAGYKPFTVYNNQKTVDNARLGRGLFGPTDRLHNELVDSQYNRGN
jgi:hypothetical protein